jgi:hypothetical protein
MIAWWCAGLLTQGAHGGRPVPCILLAASHLTIPTDFPLHLHAFCSYFPTDRTDAPPPPLLPLPTHHPS